MTQAFPIQFLWSNLNLQQHPVLQEGIYTKYNYIRVLYVTLKQLDMSVPEDALEAYLSAFGITDREVENWENPIHKKQMLDFLKKMMNTKVILNNWGIYNKDYIVLLLSDLMYMTQFTYKRIEETKPFQDIVAILKVNPESIKNIRRFFTYLFDYNLDQANEIAKMNGYNNLLLYLESFKEDNRFSAIKSNDIVVVGTMSAGKSTILNTLIDHQIFPSENKACTAKIVEFVCRNGKKRVTGMAVSEDTLDTKWFTKFTDIKEWNGKSTLKTIYLEGETGPFSLVKNKVRFIDTPGTNHSRDQEHYRITADFINENRNCQVIYILNATGLAITDDLTLVKRVIDIVDHKNILFILNKMDQLDIDGGDNIREMVDEAITYLRDLGIQSPMLYPVSGFAANLFKRALFGDALSRKEAREFHYLMEQFSDPRYDMRILVQAGYQTYDSIIGNHEIEIAGKRYEINKIIVALNMTGFPSLEQQLFKEEE
jgi:small GTP-binding protein